MRTIPARLPILVLLCAVALSTPSGAQAQPEPDAPDALDAPKSSADADATADLDALVHNAALLDELLTRSTKEMITAQKFVAAAGIAGGTILLGLSGWRLLETPPQSQYSRGLGVMFMTLGMADLTTGVFAATRIIHERRRQERWEKALKDGITDIELAHFEGELQASHEARQSERLLVRWAAFTHALAGVVILGLTPIPDNAGGADRVSGYVIGAVFFAVGSATFGVSFRKAPSEKAWEEYNTRKTPMPGHEVSWGVAPSISRHGAGLSFGGTF
ncbi:MAG: hypothetical protein ACN4G0_14540 [Polyangiales bacterium]